VFLVPDSGGEERGTLVYSGFDAPHAEGIDTRKRGI
jgi:hypothetical protein